MYKYLLPISLTFTMSTITAATDFFAKIQELAAHQNTTPYMPENVEFPEELKPFYSGGILYITM